MELYDVDCIWPKIHSDSMIIIDGPLAIYVEAHDEVAMIIKLRVFKFGTNHPLGMLVA